MKVGKFFFAATLGFVAVGSAKAAPALDFTGGFEAPAGNEINVGWTFTTNQAVNVVALDDWVTTGGTYTVDLYTGSGAVLASAVVSTSDPIESSGNQDWYTHAITPVTLAANTQYFIATINTAADSTNPLEATPTTDAAITYGGGVGNYSGGSLPTSNGFGWNGAYFNPNLDLAPATAVPLPSSAWTSLALMGGLGLLKLRNRKATLA